MPIVSVPSSASDKNTTTYYLIAFDKSGKEISGQEGLTSEKALSALSEEPFTDVFLMSHGWQSDVPSAKKQYDEWISAMAESEDAQKIRASRPNFKPLMIGLHWPSKPYGNEDLNASFSLDAAEPQTDAMIESYAAEVSDTQATREAFRDIIASENKLHAAYQTLLQEAYASDAADHSAAWEQSESLLGSSQLSSASDNIGESDVNFSDDASFGLGDSLGSIMPGLKNIVLTVPRLASYWKMKNLARIIGETSGFDLLKKLQQKAHENVRFHLMGHSFGTIFVSSMLRGPEKDSQLLRPVNSLSLVQGAVSLWSYCPKVPKRENLEGYFYPVLQQKKVDGPIITTLSRHDFVVKRMYPIASWMGRVGGTDIDFDVNFGGAAYPELGGIGTYGIQGDGLLEVEDILMKPTGKAYRFKSGVIYNLNSDEFIENGGRDAHGAFAKPEVAHAIWSAAFSL